MEPTTTTIDRIRIVSGSRSTRVGSVYHGLGAVGDPLMPFLGLRAEGHDLKLPDDLTEVRVFRVEVDDPADDTGKHPTVQVPWAALEAPDMPGLEDGMSPLTRAEHDAETFKVLCAAHAPDAMLRLRAAGVDPYDLDSLADFPPTAKHGITLRTADDFWDAFAEGRYDSEDRGMMTDLATLFDVLRVREPRGDITVSAPHPFHRDNRTAPKEDQ